MALSDIVNVEISLSSPGVTQAGFGVPLILSVNAAWTERVRFYTDISGVADDFDETDPEYLAASAIFSQSPRPPRIAIGRLALKPTQKWTVTPTPANTTVYAMTVNGSAISVTSDADATATEIVTLLKTAINALVGGPVATGTTTLVLTAATGEFHSVVIANPDLLSLVQDHADPGVATDLAAINLEDSTWYLIVNLFNSKAMVSAIAAWAEANEKLFLYASQDTECATVAVGSATDVMATLKTAAYFRTAGIYHPDNGVFADAAWAGKCLPFDPGSETWALKTLATIPAVKMTATQATNVWNKNGQPYLAVAGRNVTATRQEGGGGRVAGGEYIDVIRFRDWLKARSSERIFGTLSDNANPKIPYTDKGINMIAGDLRGTLLEGVAVGGLESFEIQVPKAKDANPTDKANRLLKNLNATGVLAGAIHAVKVKISVTV